MTRLILILFILMKYLLTILLLSAFTASGAVTIVGTLSSTNYGAADTVVSNGLSARLLATNTALADAIVAATNGISALGLTNAQASATIPVATSATSAAWTATTGTGNVVLSNAPTIYNLTVLGTQNIGTLNATNMTGNASGLTNIPHVISEASYGTTDRTNACTISTSWGQITNAWTITSGSMEGWQVVTNGIQYTNSADAMIHSATTISFKGQDAEVDDYYFAMAKNGTVIEQGRIVDSAVTANIESTALHTFVMVSQNDVIQLYAKSPDATSVTLVTMNFVAMSLK